MKKILIACVNYHHSKEVIEYINHLKKQSIFKQIDIVVTDNSECDEAFNELINHLDKEVVLANPQRNLGYIHGINYGISKYLENHDMPEWIVVSNTDISYQEESFYEKLLTYYPFGYDCIIAPCIYSTENNLYQNPLLINKYSKLKMYVLTYIFKFTWIERCFNSMNDIKNKFQKRKNSLLPNQEIYTGHGACLILNRSYFEKGGNLNYGSFLFGEEIYIAEMVRKIGGKVYFDNRLKVNHDEHTTINKESREKINHFYFESMEYLYKTFY